MEHVFHDAFLEVEYTADPVAFNKKLTEPMFIGQGCSYSVGSDCYGKYIVEKKELGKKTIWGITSAKSHFARSWTDGTEICDGPVSWKAVDWIMKWRNRWWYCDENGKRFLSSKCHLSFNGAHSYQDPSF